jgi:2-amino-4-hydroxy-6-hydroxymethyldihydropteridine diphosphokinase
MLTVNEIFIAAGSNVQPLPNLRIALRELKKHYPDMRLSTAYQNSAVGFVGDDFINLVVAFATNHSLQQVIANMHAAEALCGRLRTAPKYEPRSMDLDLLLYGSTICDEQGVKLPRPDLLKRAFMLQPMAELAPSLRHPTEGKSMQQLWNESRLRDHVMTPIEFSID